MKLAGVEALGRAVVETRGVGRSVADDDGAVQER